MHFSSFDGKQIILTRSRLHRLSLISKNLQFNSRRPMGINPMGQTAHCRALRISLPWHYTSLGLYPLGLHPLGITSPRDNIPLGLHPLGITSPLGLHPLGSTSPWDYTPLGLHALRLHHVGIALLWDYTPLGWHPLGITPLWDDTPSGLHRHCWSDRKNLTVAVLWTPFTRKKKIDLAKQF